MRIYEIRSQEIIFLLNRFNLFIKFVNLRKHKEQRSYMDKWKSQLKCETFVVTLDN